MLHSLPRSRGHSGSLRSPIDNSAGNIDDLSDLSQAVAMPTPILDLNGLKKPKKDEADAYKEEMAQLLSTLEYKSACIEQLRGEVQKSKAWADQNYHMYKSIYHEKELKWKNELKTLHLAIE